MTADVFRRLALIFGCSAWAVGVALVWIHVDWFAAVAALIAGPAGAILLSLEPAAEPEAPGEPAGLGHRAIARRARAAQGGDDD